MNTIEQWLEKYGKQVNATTFKKWFGDDVVPPAFAFPSEQAQTEFESLLEKKLIAELEIIEYGRTTDEIHSELNRQEGIE